MDDNTDATDSNTMDPGALEPIVDAGDEVTMLAAGRTPRPDEAQDDAEIAAADLPNGKGEARRKGNILLRKIAGEATAGDEQTYSEGEFARTWAIAHTQDEFLYVDNIGWLRFNDGRWSDGMATAQRTMTTLIKARVEQTKAAPKFDRYSAIEGALKMARVEPSESRTVEISTFDADAMLVGLPAGQVFDISEGETRPATPDDRIRKALAVAPGYEPSQLWATFVFESLSHYADAERDRVALWLQEFCGAMLTGDCTPLCQPH